MAESIKNEGNGRPPALIAADRAAADRHEEGAPHDRNSPDPLRSTDRYRLVTPHADRL